MFTTEFAQQLLKHILTSAPIPAMSDAAKTANSTIFYCSLHTADPGALGKQETNEVNYTGYARVAITRTAGAWIFNAASASPAARIEFGEVRGGATQEATWVGIGLSAEGAGRLLLRGKLTPSVTCKTGVLPAIKNTATISFVVSEA